MELRAATQLLRVAVETADNEWVIKTVRDLKYGDKFICLNETNRIYIAQSDAYVIPHLDGVGDNVAAIQAKMQGVTRG